MKIFSTEGAICIDISQGLNFTTVLTYLNIKVSFFRLLESSGPIQVDLMFTFATAVSLSSYY